MSLLFLDGMDYLSETGGGTAAMVEKWNTASDPIGTADLEWFKDKGRFGGGAAQITRGTGSPSLERVFPSTGTVVVGFAFNPSIQGAVFQLNLDGDPQCWMEVEVDNTVTWYNTQSGGAGINIIAESSSTGKAFNDGQWYHVELKVTAGDGSGTLEMRVNEEVWLNVSGAITVSSNNHDLSDPANVKYGSWAFGSVGVAGVTPGGGSCLVDDVYIMDTAGSRLNDFIGDVRVETLQPTADTVQADFTPLSGGANYLEIDDPERDEDSSYNESDTVGDKDLFDMEQLGTSPDTIFALQATISARKTEAGSRGLQAVLDIGGTEYSGAEHLLLQDYVYEMTIWETSPDTGSPWTESEVNALNAGYTIST